jgi:diguanylate cyclase (GGDEF)-like protein
MSDSSVPVIVLTSRRDDVEYFNKTMRDAGHAVRCRHLTRLQEFQAAVAAEPPHLFVLFADTDTASVLDVSKARQTHAPMAPLIVIRDTAEEDVIADAMRSGAQDLVSMNQAERLCAVCVRELRTYRLRRSLSGALKSVAQYKVQIKQLMAGTVDAICLVQEGIVVEVNQAWADLFTAADTEAALGPLMDYFSTSSHAELRSALAAVAKGRWQGEQLQVEAQTPEGAATPVVLGLESSTYDGEPAIRLCIPRERVSAQEPAVPASTGSSWPQLIEPGAPAAQHQDPVTGLSHRRFFLEQLSERLKRLPAGGAHVLLFVRPDKFRQIERQVGAIASEDILSQLASMLVSTIRDGDLNGRFSGTVFAFLLARSDIGEVEIWAKQALDRIAEHVFEVADHSLSLTCTIGMTEICSSGDRLEDLLGGAERAIQLGRQQGGNKAILDEPRDESTRVQRIDALWVKQIKSALVDERFRLVHLNIASLGGRSERCFDTVVRMIDEQGDEVAAADFITTARRNKLLRPVDRWVIGASIEFCSRKTSDLVFVKLSHESVLDLTLADWVRQKLAQAGVGAGNLCFQVTEEDASQYQKQTRAMAERLRAIGCKFAVEQLGRGRDPIRVLENTPMDFVKFDGDLMTNIASDFERQDQLKRFVDIANRLEIGTIATHVENAHTMAVLFQLGIGYMQGHYLHEPEVVLEGVG